MSKPNLTIPSTTELSRHSNPHAFPFSQAVIEATLHFILFYLDTLLVPPMMGHSESTGCIQRYRGFNKIALKNVSVQYTIGV